MKSRYTRLAASDVEASQSATETNTFRFVFNNEKVGRDLNIVRNRGIQYANYLRNPVVCWCHDDSQPPIGSGSNISTIGPDARIDVTFVDRDILPFAGTVRDLVAGKWLRALSMCCARIEWNYSTDRTRPGGIDFTKVDLLEVSVVPLPALPDALADARSRGINLQPLARWAEHALDARMYRSLERSRVEAIYRAAAPRYLTRADRQRRAREIRQQTQCEHVLTDYDYALIHGYGPSQRD